MSVQLWVVDDELWAVIEQVLPPWPERSHRELRYVVEQALALLHQCKRHAVRWQRRLDLHGAFISLGCALICWRRLRKATA